MLIRQLINRGMRLKNNIKMGMKVKNENKRNLNSLKNNFNKYIEITRRVLNLKKKHIVKIKNDRINIKIF